MRLTRPDPRLFSSVAVDQGLPGKSLAASWAGAGFVGVVFDDAFDEILYERAFAVFPVFEQRSLALLTRDLNSANRSFFVGFGHADC